MNSLTKMRRGLKQRLIRIVNGNRALYCPVCKMYAGGFKSFGLVPRSNAQCPNCGSLERHRMIKTFFEELTPLLDGNRRRMLHFAPEFPLESFFNSVPKLDRITTDLFDESVKLKANICDLPLEESSFDTLYCSHVLEHVPDDRLAMSECYRVLKPSGFAVFMVPITVASTIEDPTIEDPQERIRLFGQDDHVRAYGPDFEDRLKEAGFTLKRFTAQEILGDRVAKFAVPMNEHPVFLAKK